MAILLQKAQRQASEVRNDSAQRTGKGNQSQENWGTSKLIQSFTIVGSKAGLD